MAEIPSEAPKVLSDEQFELYSDDRASVQRILHYDYDDNGVEGLRKFYADLEKIARQGQSELNELADQAPEPLINNPEVRRMLTTIALYGNGFSTDEKEAIKQALDDPSALAERNKLVCQDPDCSCNQG